jgi:hypothetical protein
MFFNNQKIICSRRLLARTLPFQGGKDGSKPFGSTILKHTILLVHTTGYERVLIIVCFNMVKNLYLRLCTTPNLWRLQAAPESVTG